MATSSGAPPFLGSADNAAAVAPATLAGTSKLVTLHVFKDARVKSLPANALWDKQTYRLDDIFAPAHISIGVVTEPDIKSPDFVDDDFITQLDDLSGTVAPRPVSDITAAELLDLLDSCPAAPTAATTLN